MKKKEIYDEMLTINNLYKMWDIVKKTCKNKKELLEFSTNISTNINQIYIKLKTKTYEPSKYKLFLIYEPKIRLVMSQKIEDKIIKHFITNYYLIPLLENKLIDSNVATRKNKGSKHASFLIKKI